MLFPTEEICPHGPQSWGDGVITFHGVGAPVPFGKPALPQVKKLVYVYLVRYAEEQQDLALLSISTFQRGLKVSGLSVPSWGLGLTGAVLEEWAQGGA